MNKEYMRKLFEVLGQIDDLAEPLKEKQEQIAAQEAKAAKEMRGETCMDGETEIPKWATKIVPDRINSRRYSKEFKKMIVRLHKDEGWTFTKITEEYGVSKATITKWCSDARYENTAILQEKSRELENIQQEYEKVKEENIFLKRIVIMMFGKEMEVRQ